KERRQAHLPARHARGRRRQQRTRIHDVADWPRISEQRTWRHRQGDDARRAARVRNRQAAHDPRRSDGMSLPAADHYSPQLRTALVLTGTGTAGAYHAGVLRALHEAGVKLDVVAGRGIGVVGALFAAIDGTQRLWEDKGFWRGDVCSFYGWRTAARVIGWALGLSVVVVAVPLAVIAAGLVVFPID